MDHTLRWGRREIWATRLAVSKQDVNARLKRGARLTPARPQNCYIHYWVRAEVLGRSTVDYVRSTPPQVTDVVAD